MGRRLGLIIGVNSYQDTAFFKALQFAETDARALAQWLVNSQGGKWGSSDVQLLLGAQATSPQVESLITRLCVTAAEPDDLVFIYFAGHAFLDEKNGEGHLALTDTYYKQPATGLHLLSLARYAIGQSRAGQVLLVLDCFQTGPIWSLQRSSPYDCKPLLGTALLSALQRSQARLLMCSCRGNELARETGERNLGVLAHRMILGLSGQAADPATGNVTLQRLHSFLFNALNEQQRPQLFGQGADSLVLIGDTSPFRDIQYVQPAANARLTEQATQLTPAAAAQISSQSTRQSPAVTEKPKKRTSKMLLAQAQQLMQMQNPVEALMLVEQVLETEPDNVNALMLKGQLFGMAGRFQEALSAVEQLLRVDPKNALGWSMRAAILTNTGRFLDALPAVERSLQLDPRNPETHAIKATIMANLTPARDGFRNSQRTLAVTVQKRGGAQAFFMGLVIHVLGLAIGIAGAALPILRPTLPIYVALLLESLGLALLCVNAARGSYLYGGSRFFLTLLTSLLIAGSVGGIYKFAYHRAVQVLQDHPEWFAPTAFLGLWLAAAAAVPLLLAFGGFIGGVARGVRRR